MTSTHGANGTALVVLDEWPWPIRSGMQLRAAQMLETLASEGMTLIALLPARALRADMAPPPLPIRLTAVGEGAFDAALRRMSYWMHRLARREIGWASLSRVPIGQQLRVMRLTRRLRPAVVLVMLAKNAAAVRWLPREAHTLLDAVDIFSLNRDRWIAVERIIGPAPVDPHTVSASGLEADVSSSTPVAPDCLDVVASRQFDRALLIGREEAAQVAALAPGTDVCWFPFVMPPKRITRTFGGAAILVVGVNPFNRQGHAWLVAEVIPLVHAEIPEFQVFVAGPGSNDVIGSDGVTSMGEFDDIAAMYGSARMALAPQRNGTGQPIKVLEAAAHGIPSVMTSYAARRTGIVHGRDGFVADTPVDFAEAMVTFWRDAEKARRMGDQAATCLARQRDALAADMPLRPRGQS